LLISKHLI